MRTSSSLLRYSRGGNYFDSLAALFIVGGIIYVLVTFELVLYRREEKNKNLRRLFEQTATALVNAIDAKDKYTHRHSSRVAEYSSKIAAYSGKSQAECDEIYYVALLHDVGKIGIPEAIINKEGNRITTTTGNFGINVKCVTTIPDDAGEVYVSLTGDQCAITNIKIKNTAESAS